MPISDAIKRGDIVVEYSSTRRSVPITDIINVLTVRRRVIDDLYSITGAVDARTAETVNCAEALVRRIVDFTDPAGEFVNTRTGERLPLHDAIEYGWVSQWRSGVAVRLAISRSWVQFPPGQSCVTTLGKLFTPMCLCHQAV